MIKNSILTQTSPLCDRSGTSFEQTYLSRLKLVQWFFFDSHYFAISPLWRKALSVSVPISINPLASYKDASSKNVKKFTDKGTDDGQQAIMQKFSLGERIKKSYFK